MAYNFLDRMPAAPSLVDDLLAQGRTEEVLALLEQEAQSIPLGSGKNLEALSRPPYRVPAPPVTPAPELYRAGVDFAREIPEMTEAAGRASRPNFSTVGQPFSSGAIPQAESYVGKEVALSGPRSLVPQVERSIGKELIPLGVNPPISTTGRVVTGGVEAAWPSEIDQTAQSRAEEDPRIQGAMRAAEETFNDPIISQLPESPTLPPDNNWSLSDLAKDIVANPHNPRYANTGILQGLSNYYSNKQDVEGKQIAPPSFVNYGVDNPRRRNSALSVAEETLADPRLQIPPQEFPPTEIPMRPGFSNETIEPQPPEPQIDEGTEGSSTRSSLRTSSGQTPGMKETEDAINAQANQAADEQDRYSRMLDSSQRSADSNQFMANMLRAGTMASAALSGQKADFSAVDALSSQSGASLAKTKELVASLKDWEEGKSTRELRDPNSSLSKQLREKYLKLFPGSKIGENTSAEAMGKSGINLMSLATMQDKRDESAAARQAERSLMEMKLKEASLEKSGKSKDKLKEVNSKFKENAYDDLKKPWEETSKVLKAYDGIEKDFTTGKPSGVKDLRAIYSFISALDPRSTVREGEVKLTQSAASMLDRVGLDITRLTSSDLMSAKNRTQILEQMRSLKEMHVSGYKDFAKSKYAMAESYGIPQEEFNQFDPSLNYEKRSVVQSPNATQGYTDVEERGIQRVMDSNKVSREVAISGLKKAKRLK